MAPRLALSAFRAESRQNVCRFWRDAVVVGSAIALGGCGASSQLARHCSPPACRSVERQVVAGEQMPSRVARLLQVWASRLASSRPSSSKPVKFRDREYALEIINVGAPNAYTRERTLLHVVRVMPDSAADEYIRVVSAGFVSRSARLHWEASGSPRLPDKRRAAYAWKDPPRSFSFVPHGSPLTFGQARRLPSTPVRVAERFRRSLGARGGDPTTNALLLRQYGFALAVAPISARVRKALLRAMALLPGLSSCGRRTDRGSRVVVLCLVGGATRTEVILNPRSGLALTVRERLEEPSPLYPGVAVGDLVDSDTFLAQTDPAS